MDESEDQTNYLVVINHEEQYSIWPDYKDIPNGWHSVGKSGPKKECLDYIAEVWTDMRPLSLRRAMESQNRNVN
jgi:MbtH protein